MGSVGSTRRAGHEIVERDNAGKTVTGAYTVKPGERLIRVAPAAACDITLPPPSRWAGQTITILAVDDNSANPATANVTVKASGYERRGFVSDTVAVLDADNEDTVVYSDGENVHELAGNHA